MTTDAGRDDAPVVTRDEDDEALSWGPTSADTSYLETPVDDVPVAHTDEDDEDDEDELPDGVMSSTMLVVHGVFGAIFLLFTVAWLRSVGNVQPSFDSSLAAAMWRIGTYLAVAGPAIWFVGTILLLPTSRSRTRVVSFIVGVVILLPWPFVIGALS
ncbi:hypothetical protein GCM10025867_34730 [Frondihabitans sucicola]|uniref:DNA polymerase III subunit gamma/tau n=1 Tax=Frondihabitans sucicola TaxID=1268041 RepID=A0ABM8GRZ1_9MICO|nr:hypothetical protein [Frondihabitans sucicola]BDZ51232.1 hypothetical protein GCM10025867_34730 [Frondihabitans sucicola]